MSQRTYPGAGGTAHGAGDASPAQVDNPDNTTALAQGMQPRRLSRDDPKQTSRIIRHKRTKLSFAGKRSWGNTNAAPSSGRAR